MLCMKTTKDQMLDSGDAKRVFWGPELANGPKVWLFHLLDNTRKKKNKINPAYFEVSVGSQKLSSHNVTVNSA